MLHIGVQICPYLQAQSYQTQDVQDLFIPCFEENPQEPKRRKIVPVYSDKYGS